MTDTFQLTGRDPVAPRPPVPRVSVVVPVYNGERYLRRSLDSILAQTYHGTDILVMDDASTDGPAAILETYGGRIRVIRQTANRGQFGNVNDGIAQAQGEYVCVYHADDIYLPSIIEREVDFLDRHPAVGAVFTGMIFMDPDDGEFGRLRLPTGIPAGQPLDYRTVLCGLLEHTNHFLVCPSAMVRASVYRDVGLYRDVYGTTADLEMWLRIARKYPVGVIEDNLVRYRKFHENASLRYNRLRTGPACYFEILDDHLAAGGAALVAPEHLAAHEAHRSQDLLMALTSNYILGDRAR